MTSNPHGNEWHYRGKPFDTEAYQKIVDLGYIGMVYEITDHSTGQKYIGKKLLTAKRKLPPLKGQKKKRNVVVETDWRKYYGSSESVQEMVKERPADFSREVLFLCKMKGELSYLELREQILREVLLDDKYANNFLGAKIHGAHIKGLRKDNPNMIDTRPVI